MNPLVEFKKIYIDKNCKVTLDSLLFEMFENCVLIENYDPIKYLDFISDNLHIIEKSTKNKMIGLLKDYFLTKEENNICTGINLRILHNFLLLLETSVSLKSRRIVLLTGVDRESLIKQAGYLVEKHGNDFEWLYLDDDINKDSFGRHLITIATPEEIETINRYLIKCNIDISPIIVNIKHKDSEIAKEFNELMTKHSLVSSYTTSTKGELDFSLLATHLLSDKARLGR